MAATKKKTTKKASSGRSKVDPEAVAAMAGQAQAAARQAVLAVEADLQGVLLEREEETHGVLLALLAKAHLFQLGVPGVGKSLLADELVARLDGLTKYEILFGRFTTPEEVFGPPSLRALREQDRFLRNGQGMLQEAQVAFLDEVFKANSAVLNTLLPILNERVYREGGVAQAVPLETMVCASNELPQGEDLAALYDRILFRFVVQPLSDRGMRQLLLNPPALRSPSATITADQLRAAQAAVQAVKVGEDTVASIMRLRGALAGQKGVYVSPRRWRACLDAVKAEAWLDGRDQTEDQDLLVLAHCLWADPDHKAAVEVAVIDVAAPALREVRELLDVAVEVAASYRKTSDENVRVESLMKLRGLAVKAGDKAAKAGDAGRKIAAKVAQLHQEAVEDDRRRQAERYGADDLFEEV